MAPRAGLGEGLRPLRMNSLPPWQYPLLVVKGNSQKRGNRVIPKTKKLIVVVAAFIALSIK